MGLGGRTIGMRTFGSSTPLKDLQEKFGFTPEAVAKEATALVSISKRSE